MTIIEDNEAMTEHTAMHFTVAQLAPTEPLAAMEPPAISRLPANDPEGDSDDEHNATISERFTKANLRRVISERLIAARQLNGLSQGELARLMAFANQTQVALWERGVRLPPIYAFQPLAEVLGVSLDYLFGVDDEPERNSRQAAINAIHRRMRAALEENARTVTGAMLEACRFDAGPAIRETRLLSLVVELCDAVATFRDRNPALFDEARAGALLLRTADEARSAAATVGKRLDSAERRAEAALKRARGAAAANDA